MNLRSLVLLLSIIVAIVVAFVFFMPGGSDPIAETQASTASPQQTVVLGETAAAASAALEKPVDWKHFDALLSEMLGGFPKASDADFEPFLKKRGETAANFIVLFEQTSDRKWLERALAAFPNSPIVLMAALLDNSEASPEQCLDWLEKLKAAEPSNPVPWLIAAHLLFKQDHPAEAAAEAAIALERPAFYTYSSERIAAARALFEDMGLHPLEAELVGTFSLRCSLLSSAMAVSKGLEAMKVGNDATDATAANAARIQHALGKMFQTPEASRFLIGQLTGIAMETKGLTSQPQAVQEKRKAEMDAARAEIRALMENSNDVITTHDESLVKGYLLRLRTDGELSALRWMKAQKK